MMLTYRKLVAAASIRPGDPGMTVGVDRLRGHRGICLRKFG